MTAVTKLIYIFHIIVSRGNIFVKNYILMVLGVIKIHLGNRIITYTYARNISPRFSRLHFNAVTQRQKLWLI